MCALAISAAVFNRKVSAFMSSRDDTGCRVLNVFTFNSGAENNEQITENMHNPESVRRGKGSQSMQSL